MIRLISALSVAALLAGCGADGEPHAPEPKPVATTGVTVSGYGRVGVSVSTSGVYPSGAVTLSRSPVNLISGF
jgi:hypothetical protein